MNRKRILVVGGVAGGASAATRARRLNPHAEIVIFERGGYVSFANCGLPYYVGDIIEDRKQLLLQSPEMFRRRFDIDVRIRHEVMSINRGNRTVSVTNLDTGVTTDESYDRLILSPGASPIRPRIEGHASDNVFVLRDMKDADALRAYIDQGQVRRATIIGAGFIGLEVAETLAHRGIGSDIVDLAPQVLTPLDADMAAHVAVHLKEKGVEVHLGTKPERFETCNNRVIRTHLDNGKALDADLVLMAIGVRPNSKLAADAGLDIGSSGAIVVNDRMQTSDPNILAAGDAVAVIHAVTGKSAFIPLAGPANKHGRLAGGIAATDAGRSAARVAGTAVVQVFDLNVAVTGLSHCTAKKAGIGAEHVVVKRGHHVGYYPGAEAMTIKLVFESATRKVLGAQIVGGAGVDRRIDVVATVIHFGGTVDDLADLDLAYAPQFGAAKDPIHIAAFVAANQADGLVCHADPSDIPALAKRGYQLIDVRSKEEFENGTIPGAINVSVDDLREGADGLGKDRPVLLFCQVGQRGYYAARILAGLGRKDVVNLAGGYASYAVQMAAAGGTTGSG